MTTLEKLSLMPMPMPMAGHRNGSTSLESIVGKLQPALEKYEPYLIAVAHYRKIWSRTGVYPFDEAKHSLARLRGDTPQEEIRRILDSQLNKICEVFPVPNPTKIKSESIERALVVHGEVKPDSGRIYNPKG